MAKPKIDYSSGYKFCGICKETLLLSSYNFYKSGVREGRPFGACKVCAAERNKIWYLNNIGIVTETSKIWANNNPNKIKEIKKNYCDRYPDKVKAGRRNYAIKNPDKINAFTAHRRSMKLNATPSWIDPGYVAMFYTMAKDAEATTGLQYHVDHIVPLSSEFVCGFHSQDNLQVLEAKENISKGNRYWPDMNEITPELKQMMKDFHGIN